MATRLYLEGAVLLAVVLVVDAEAHADVEPRQENKALGLAMLGAVFFVMGVYFLTHSLDSDIRLMAWTTINDTISIFCAVMVYSSATDLCLAVTPHQLVSSDAMLSLNKVYIMIWYVLFVGSVAWCAGVGKGRNARMDIAKKEPLNKPVCSATGDGPHSVTEIPKILFNGRHYGTSLESAKRTGIIAKPKSAGADTESSFSKYTQMKSNLRCCTSFAHTIGFAGMAGWKLRMDSEWFRDAPWHCATLVPLAILHYYLAIKTLQFIRDFLLWMFVEGSCHPCAKDGGKEGQHDELLEVGKEVIRDGENDVYGLCISTLIVSTVKFRVGGKLDGEEDYEYKFTRSIGQAAIMYGFAIFFFFSAYGLLECRRKLEEAEDKRDTFYEKSSRKFYTYLLDREHSTDAIIKEGARTIKRLADLCVKFFTMSFAWCFIFATTWLFGHFLGDEASVLAIILAMYVSVVAVLLLYFIDFLADQRETEKEQDKVLRTLLKSVGILIGFVWESAFDLSLEGIASDDASSDWVKPVLGLLTVVCIFPVWRYYIVPMEVEKGYVLGFIPSKVAHKLDRIFNDHSTSKDVKDSARIAFEEVVMVLLAFDDPEDGIYGTGANTMKGLLETYFQQQEENHLRQRQPLQGYQPPGRPASSWRAVPPVYQSRGHHVLDAPRMPSELVSLPPHERASLPAVGPRTAFPSRRFP